MLLRRRLPRHLPKKQFVVQHPDTPHITLLGVAVVHDRLRTHVERGPDIVVHLILWGVHHLGETKVCDFGNSLSQEYVCRFEITMDDALTNLLLESIHDMLEDLSRLGFGNCNTLLEHTLQITLFAVCHNNGIP